MKRAFAVAGPLALLVAVAACSGPATKISSELQRYGLDKPRADCVGERLRARLSMHQLDHLGNAAATYRTDHAKPDGMTPADLVRVASELHDPRIALEVGKAADKCGILP